MQSIPPNKNNANTPTQVKQPSSSSERKIADQCHHLQWLPPACAIDWHTICE
jgi:hypothetical protein